MLQAMIRLCPCLSFALPLASIVYFTLCSLPHSQPLQIISRFRVSLDAVSSVMPSLTAPHRGSCSLFCFHNIAFYDYWSYCCYVVWPSLLVASLRLPGGQFEWFPGEIEQTRGASTIQAWLHFLNVQDQGGNRAWKGPGLWNERSLGDPWVSNFIFQLI